ncbi:hypothetical protein L873DRAFT_1382273 [Choiromyces venosus 120613-1]|uniref:Uncharacterized protein n=1 Tax=Choiromyces venosus 120613-1 TaxID=1336337 RepID=A0A3N4J9I9_9PEZI|nr:hypothetical protein L873DRAFT_1382273 [Choiromyces venosus 120613-1]
MRCHSGYHNNNPECRMGMLEMPIGQGVLFLISTHGTEMLCFTVANLFFLSPICA